MKLVDRVICSFDSIKTFKENTDIITNIDFSPNGRKLIACGKDDRIGIYDCEKGKHLTTIYSKKYGVNNIRFTHSNTTAIYSSTKVNNTIRYLSLPENKFIRYFSGHSDEVLSLCVSPIENHFISSSLDKTVRIWDLRSPASELYLQIGAHPVATYDPEGLVLAAAVDAKDLNLYDLRNMKKGPFLKFDLSENYNFEVISTKFSENGKFILVNTNRSLIKMIDAFNGKLLQTLIGRVINTDVPTEVSISPDSQYVFSGSRDGDIHVWRADNGYKITIFNEKNAGSIHCVQFNPKYMMLASASTNITFWLPTTEDSEET